MKQTRSPQRFATQLRSLTLHLWDVLLTASLAYFLANATADVMHLSNGHFYRTFVLLVLMWIGIPLVKILWPVWPFQKSGPPSPTA